jgi:hypothetical protein
MSFERLDHSGGMTASRLVDGATQILRARAGAGNEYAASRLARWLAERGDLDGATQILRARADAGDGRAAVRLASAATWTGPRRSCAPGPTPATSMKGRGEEAERLRRFGLNPDVQFPELPWCVLRAI